MVTFKPIIIPNNRRKDGTYPVKIRVTFKGVSRRLPTTLVCQPSDITRDKHIKSADILEKGNDLIKQMRATLKDVSPFDLDNWNVDRVVRHIREKMIGERFALDFFEWSERYIEQNKVGTTRGAYISALNALERFLGCRSLDINDISRSMLLDFVDFVDNEPKMRRDPVHGGFTECSTEKLPKGASSRHLMKLQHLFNAAKDRYNDEDEDRILIPKSPFDKIVKVFPPSSGQKNLGQALMQRIISAQVSDTITRYCLDAFIVSFGLMGANLADLYNAIPFEEDWTYNRQKTRTRRADRAEMRVRIPEELEPYISRLQSHKGEWWLPTLHHLGSTKDLCTARVNRVMKRWCEANGITPFTFYAARHTWASLARKAGVEKAVVDECLCHVGDFRMADIYAERSWDIINDANRKVIDLFIW